MTSQQEDSFILKDEDIPDRVKHLKSLINSIAFCEDPDGLFNSYTKRIFESETPALTLHNFINTVEKVIKLNETIIDGSDYRVFLDKERLSQRVPDEDKEAPHPEYEGRFKPMSSECEIFDNESPEGRAMAQRSLFRFWKSDMLEKLVSLIDKKQPFTDLDPYIETLTEKKVPFAKEYIEKVYLRLLRCKARKYTVSQVQEILTKLTDDFIKEYMS